VSETKVLNLYGGIGGKRKLWEDVDVTAVEWDSEKAEVYRDHFPEDTVVEADAHEYLKENYSEYEFIWASPPCPTHSQMQRTFVHDETKQNANREFVYPDMKLYQEILLLDNFFDGDYAVENVVSYYDPLVKPQEVGRHYIWSNYPIADVEVPVMDIQASVDKYENDYGYDLSDYDLNRDKKVKMLRNCVHPKLGKHVFESRGKQTTLI